MKFLRLIMVLLVLLASFTLAGCNNMFFQPDQYLYYDPAKFGVWHEQVEFKSLDGTNLTGWFLPGNAPLYGTVIHFHGNAANISNHIAAVSWLPAMGFSVFLFDYRGYGASEGIPSRVGAIEDGVAAINYIKGRKDIDANRLIVFGQSLGGALAVSSLAQAGSNSVKALVVEGAFHSYREVVRLIMKDTWISWPFQYPVAYIFFSDHLSPLDALPQLSGVPFLVVHGEKDHTVPIEAGRRLFEAFPGQDKKFWEATNLGHQEIFTPKGSPWRKKLVEYFISKVGKLPEKPRYYPLFPKPQLYRKDGTILPPAP